MKPITFTRGPGGLPGIDVHAGAWMALEEKRINPKRLSGCSAGALVSALQASGMTAREFVAILRSLRTKDVIRKRRWWKARMFWITHFLDSEPIRDLLDTYLPESFEELKMPLTVSATRMDPDGQVGVTFSEGPRLREAVLASMSISGVWDYAEIGDNRFSDGGTTDSIVIPDDHDGRLLILDPHSPTDYNHRDKNMVSRLLANVAMYSQQERDATRKQLEEDGADFKYIKLPVGSTSTLEFNHDLIDRTFDMMMSRSVLGSD